MHKKMKCTKVLLFGLLAQTVFSSPTWANGWNYRNNPENIARETGFNFEYQFDKVPTEASLSQKPWPDNYWPTYQRGLANRWQGDLEPVKHPKETDAEFAIRKGKERFFTEKEILFMSEEERNKLSPAEKYDIIRKDFDNYTLTNAELDRTDPNAPTWEGICHGWAYAAIVFKPADKCKMGLGHPWSFNQQMLPVAASDTMALLSLMQGNYSTNDESYFAGTRCNEERAKVPNWKKSMHNNDINAGAFHIILVNRIGKLNSGFVFDRTTDQEVWNQPIEGYKMKVIKEQSPDLKEAAPGTVKEVEVETVVSYTVESEPYVDRLSEEDRLRFVTNQPYKYILELDKDNKVIGGRWISESYPDFVWSGGKSEFSGLFKELEGLYNKSTKTNPILDFLGNLIPKN